MNDCVDRATPGTVEPALDALLDDLGDPELVVEIVEAYLGQLPERCALLEEAARTADHATVRNVAHALRSTTELVGYPDVAGLLGMIEDAPHDAAEVVVVVVRLRALEAPLRRAMQRVGNRPAP